MPFFLQSFLVRNYCLQEFMVSALDVIGAVSEVLGPSIESLVLSTKLCDLLPALCLDNDPEVRQSAFALVGDLASNATLHLRPWLPMVLPLLVANMTNMGFVSVSNNAAWALGELCMSMPSADLAGAVPELLGALDGMLNNKRANLSLMENASITIGRLGMVLPAEVAPHLPTFASKWCHGLMWVRDPTERAHAFSGLCELVKLNAQAASTAFPQVCLAFASWNVPHQWLPRSKADGTQSTFGPPPEFAQQPLNPSGSGGDLTSEYRATPMPLKASFAQILQGFKAACGASWPAYFSQFPPFLKDVLHKEYGLEG